MTELIRIVIWWNLEPWSAKSKVLSELCWRVVGDCVYVFLLLFIIYFQIANIDT